MYFLEKLNALIRIFLYVGKDPRRAIKKLYEEANSKFYRNYIRKMYKREHLPTVDILELCENFKEEITNYSFLEGTSLPIISLS